MAAYGLGADAVVLALYALGLQVTYGVAGQLSLAVAPVAGLGAYTTAQATLAGWPWLVAVVAAATASAALSTVVGLPGVRVRGDVLALVTLGAGEVLVTVYLSTGTFFGGSDGISAPPVQVGGHPLSAGQVYAGALLLLALALAATSGLVTGPVGRAWRAVRDDDVGAAALGVRPGPLRLAAFSVGGALAGVGGTVFTGQVGFVSSTGFRLQRTVDVVLVVLVAGEGRLLRTVVAAAALTLAVDRLAGFAAVSQALTGVLVLAVVASRSGLLGSAVYRLRSGLRRSRLRRSRLRRRPGRPVPP